MKRDANSDALLQVPVSEAFIPVVTSFVENSAAGMGLGGPQSLELTLAAEEVFCHLLRVVLPQGGRVDVRCSSGGYYVRTDFSFPDTVFDLRAVNLTAAVSLADEGGLDQMGLVLASRSVDRFRIDREEGRGLTLTLIKEKAYPLVEPEGPSAAKPLKEVSIRPPEPEELKLLARLAQGRYPDSALPAVLSYPGKLVDMMSGGNYQAAVAVGPAGEVGGGTFWHRIGPRAFECFGPYLFNQGPDSPMAVSLIEACLESIAKTPAVVLINRFPSREFPREQFESLGSVSVNHRDGSTFVREAWFRLMQEDLGCPSWTHPSFEDFLRREYARLVLPRDLRRVGDCGEHHHKHSVLFTAFDRLQQNVTLHPVCFGRDIRENLVQYVELFRQEGIPNAFFAMDLGQSWQAEFAPGLLESGFEPRVLLPYAGTGDLAIFQLQGKAS